MTTSVFFEEIMQKLASRENYASEEIKCIIFYYYSSDVNCHGIQSTINQYAYNFECSRDGRLFYYYSRFYMATFHVSCQHDAKI